MQFKHPDILWALLLLVIPVVIHLFQLRRFERTPFTNVAMLQRVVSESRKSNNLKKWLLLLTRILLLASLILAFAQPFTASPTALKETETVIYLDDSFSMQAKTNGLTLMEKAVQELIKGLDGTGSFSLFTNVETYGGVQIEDIRNSLLSLGHSPKQLDLEEIRLKAGALFSESAATTKNLIVISDFQQRLQSRIPEGDSSINTYFVPLRPDRLQNLSLDSVYLEEGPTDMASLDVFLSGGEKDLALPVSLYNGENLIARTAATFIADGTAKLGFSIPAQEEINGRLSITDSGLSYDNNLYFSINAQQLIKVLSISSGDSGYLDRLYGGEGFELKKYGLDQLDHSALDGQNLVLVDHLASIPDNLGIALKNFADQGGSLVVIPSRDIDIGSYNALLSALGAGRYVGKVSSESPLTYIAYDHPLYGDVFEARVDNFQYPTLREHYGIQSELPRILGLEGGDAFLIGKEGLYIFSASLEVENSDFKNSPLIVPTFYRMAASSLRSPELYHILGSSTSIDLDGMPGMDDVLKVSKDGQGFIPLQQAYPNRIRLDFDQNPTEDGNYDIEYQGRSLQKISFNYPREEGRLQYMDLQGLQGATLQDSVDSLFDRLEAQGNIAAYWKWFVILALLMSILEVVIQKFVSWKLY